MYNNLKARPGAQSLPEACQYNSDYIDATINDIASDEQIPNIKVAGFVNDGCGGIKPLHVPSNKLGKDTKVYIGPDFQPEVRFTSDPQHQMDILESNIDTLDGHKADVDTVIDLEDNKQDYSTFKHQGDFVVNDIDDFRTKIYEQRKNTTRIWQFEINPYNVDLMSILGYPDDGISSADKAFLYVEVPYSEAGGFEIDLKLMKRDGSRVFVRRMTSTLNSNWSDTGWINPDAGGACDVANAIKDQSSFNPNGVKFSSLISIGKAREVLVLEDGVIHNKSTKDLIGIKTEGLSLIDEFEFTIIANQDSSEQTFEFVLSQEKLDKVKKISICNGQRHILDSDIETIPPITKTYTYSYLIPFTNNNASNMYCYNLGVKVILSIQGKTSRFGVAVYPLAPGGEINNISLKLKLYG